VEDDFGIRTSLVTLLLDEGYTVDEAADGEEALRLVEARAPSAVLLDMRMPRMDGWEFAATLRSREIHIPLIVMTAARDARAWAEEISAAAYVTKPFDIALLLQAIDQVCKR